MSKTRRDGFYLALLGSVIFVLLGAVLEHSSPFAMQDFKEVYYAARCLIQHQDPYNQKDVLSAYEADGGSFPGDTGTAASVRRVIGFCTNLPTTLVLIAPFTLLPFGLAATIWMCLIAGTMIFASFLMWDIGARYSPAISGGLIFLVLANCELLLIVGNAAGIVLGLSIIAVWCFNQERFTVAGLLCFAISLAVKPHDVGFVWLFLLLSGGSRRKCALQSLLLTMLLGAAAVLWMHQIVPNWRHELFSNLSVSMARGGRDDPGPASSGGHGLGSIVSLQAVFSLFLDDRRFYNPAAQLVTGALLLPILWKAFRSRISRTQHWCGLAAISALTMLPTYHRAYDAKIILLAAPACAMLGAQKGPIRRWAVVVTSVGVLCTGALSWAAFIDLISGMGLSSAQISANVEVLLPPFSLLAVGAFYMYVYFRGPWPSREGRGPEGAPRRSCCPIELSCLFLRRKRYDSGTA
jgi:hypothetical protein